MKPPPAQHLEELEERGRGCLGLRGPACAHLEPLIPQPVPEPYPFWPVLWAAVHIMDV